MYIKSISVRNSDGILIRFQTKISKDPSIKNEEDFILHNTKSGSSIYLKILLNFLQLIAIVQNLGIKWPFYSRNYFNFFENFGSVSTQAISLDCILNDFEFKIESLYAQTIFGLSLPLLTMFFARIIIGFIHILTENSRQTTRFIVIVIVSCIFLQPAIIKILYANISCKKIEESMYLKANFKIRCDSDAREQWLILFLLLFKYILAGYSLLFIQTFSYGF